MDNSIQKKTDINTLAKEEEINLLELLSVLVRRRSLIIWMTLVTALASVAYSLCLPNIYTATAKILPPQKEGGGSAAALLSQLGGGGMMAGLAGLGGTSDLYVGILKSRSVADVVIARLNLAQELKTDNPDKLRKKIGGASKGSGREERYDLPVG